MSRTKLVLIAALFVLAGLPARSFAVTNAVVGRCKSGTQFTTIQAAVNAASVGSVVQVCPGSYPEQVVIQQALTLKAISAGNSSVVTITQPSGGVQANATSGIWGSLAAQLLIQGANVTVNGISIDGTSSTCSSPNAWVGVLYQAAGGLLTNSTVANAPQCFKGISAFADATTNLTFSNNAITGCSSECIEVDYATKTTITSNTIVSTGSLANGIELLNLDGPATVSNNSLSGLGEALIFKNGTGGIITGNTVVACALGISLTQVTQTRVQSNRIAEPLEGLRIIDAPGVAGGNTVTKNTVLGAQLGLGIAKSTGDVTSPNTIVGSTVVLY